MYEKEILNMVVLAQSGEVSYSDLQGMVQALSLKIDRENKKSITIPFTETDLEDVMRGDEFDWTFNGVEVHIRLENEEDLSEDMDDDSDDLVA